MYLIYLIASESSKKLHTHQRDHIDQVGKRYKPKGDPLQIVLQCEDQAHDSVYAFPISSRHGYSSSPPQLQFQYPVKTEVLNDVKTYSKVINLATMKY